LSLDLLPSLNRGLTLLDFRAELASLDRSD
jgi:hypothetical protein